MGRIVFGAGLSHTPVLALDPKDWGARAAADMKNPRLNLSDGRWLSYQELEREVGDHYAAEANYDIYCEKSRSSQLALDRVADALQAADPDLVIIVGDDQEELFSSANQPAVCIFHGEELVTNDHFAAEDNPQWMKAVAVAYAMDSIRRFPVASTFARGLIEALIESEIDVATSARVVDPKVSGFGHAFGFVIQRLFRDRARPVVPILINTYYPPNVPTARRCLKIGHALREAILTSKEDVRVAVIASGGLSHFIVDEELDRRVLAALDGDEEVLASLPRGALNSGSSEILLWVLVAGAMSGVPLQWTDYYPIYRTPAGTGVGVGFAIWS